MLLLIIDTEVINTLIIHNWRKKDGSRNFRDHFGAPHLQTGLSAWSEIALHLKYYDVKPRPFVEPYFHSYKIHFMLEHCNETQQINI